ncbi:hypothetical protein A7A08_01714 [Methyloligella halotolerans]|uniref:DUF6950 domain-containing protein n=1 Tax=Methyloligella halotolerans TaxID=1177755 RepID=A0A1E2S040_9HYPH|nr:hypothetical protein [Methyloligella halotolerans]ODA67679.1 hypothetical protein A7A08_01714 [Methyloligella halotolerans]
MRNPRLVIHGEYERAKLEPFNWGRHDCLLWCADCAKAFTGKDPAARLRGRYSTALGAKRVMTTEGWSDMADVARSMFPEIPVASARSGDWAQIINEDGTDTLGVVMAGMIVARTEKNGLGQVPLTHAAKAFRVG